MKLEQSFTVQAPLERVWAALTDLEQVAPCLPGAEITSVDDDGTHHGTFAVKLGPASAAYRGTVRMEEQDERSHTATMRASGQDKRGQGSANATIVSRLTPDGDATKVDVDTDFTITGRLARFGRGGMIADISARLLQDFAACLQERLAAPEPLVPPSAGPPPEETQAGDVEPPSAETPSATRGVPSFGPAGHPPATEVPDPARTPEPGPRGEVPGEDFGPGAPHPSTEPDAPPERSTLPPAGAPRREVNGLRLLMQVLGARLKRLFSRGGGGG